MIPIETLLQAREEAETGNDQYSRGFVSAVITELLAARKEIEAVNQQADELPTEEMCDQARGFIIGLDLNVRKFGAMQKHLDLSGNPTIPYIRFQAEKFPENHITKWEVAECIWLLMQQKAPNQKSGMLCKN